MSLPPLIITSAVYPSDDSVALSSSDARIRYTLDAMGHWLHIEPNLKIVCCDGSGFDFSEIVASHFPHQTIECLSFQNDAERTRQLGKGYGEGEIMAYALRHSNALKQSTFFAKCTSKLWVSNFHDCLNHWNDRLLMQAKISNILKFKPLRFRHIDTRFYLMDCDTYARHFSEAYLHVNDAQDHSLEHCFREAVQRADLQEFLSPIPFVIHGHSGSTGDFFHMPARTYAAERFKLMVLNQRTNWVQSHA